jgi:hypothetical protein
VPCDVRDREALAALFAQQAPFSILVSAATGGGRALGPFLEMDMEGFAGSFDKRKAVHSQARTHASDVTLLLLLLGLLWLCLPVRVRRF